ncbi:PH domain-containing protein [Haliscomenobacter hydrossis]|uniref:Uncharacterized protein YyaB-like PH domain-containing protein n=1 Tax=Haliscomenobacter hydrossis (strain ATCC 27775 / DSM 1100 / LMG 10767 / O) TaxID=760192 RepID=F4KZH6_HALH1|nr:PH domain-containing protein [Haliscomenobacter hydrossis]AEE49446.1 protein of unknown function DUF1200 [Haliscomenobacter hydrossis DSM 1100]
MTTYPSKIGSGLVAIFVVILGGIALLMAFQAAWVGLGIIALVSAFIIHLFMTTYYQIEEKTLRVRCGFLVDQRIDITQITSVSETNNPISSPATSLDRLEICYKPHGSVIISPKDKKGFIQHLLTLQPNIEVRLKT